MTREPGGVAVIVVHTLRDCPTADAFETSSTDSPFGEAIATADDEEAAAAIAFALADDAYADAIISST